MRKIRLAKPKLAKGEVIQAIGFDKEFFDSRSKVRNWINRNGFIYANPKKPIQSFDNHFRVRQIDPKKMSPSSYREEYDGAVGYVIGKLK